MLVWSGKYRSNNWLPDVQTMDENITKLKLPVMHTHTSWTVWKVTSSVLLNCGWNIPAASTKAKSSLTTFLQDWLWLVRHYFNWPRKSKSIKTTLPTISEVASATEQNTSQYKSYSMTLPVLACTFLYFTEFSIWSQQRELMWISANPASTRH